MLAHPSIIIKVVVLLAACDAHYRFIMVDIGDAGRHSDGGILSNSEFGRALERNSLSLPPDRPLQGLFPMFLLAMKHSL